jgi:hypothetical protein
MEYGLQRDPPPLPDPRMLKAMPEEQRCSLVTYQVRIVTKYWTCWQNIERCGAADSKKCCSAMACTDSLECFGYWDLVNLVVINRGIYTS